MKKTIDRIIEKWDWLIYWFAYSSLKRMCERNNGFAYLIRLQLDDWLNKHPLDENLKHTTELFFTVLTDVEKHHNRS